MAEQTHRATADTTATAIRAIWQRNLPLMEERLQRLEAASAAAEADTLPEWQRTEGNEISHKLAGSLGMFGYPEGTLIARRLERLFSQTGFAPGEVAEVKELVGQLRVVVLAEPKTLAKS